MIRLDLNLLRLFLYENFLHFEMTVIKVRWYVAYVSPFKRTQT